MFMAFRSLIDFDTCPTITTQHNKGHMTLVHILTAVAAVGVHRGPGIFMARLKSNQNEWAT